MSWWLVVYVASLSSEAGTSLSSLPTEQYADLLWDRLYYTIQKVAVSRLGSIAGQV